MVGEIISFPNSGSLEKETVKESGVSRNKEMTRNSSAPSASVEKIDFEEAKRRVCLRIEEDIFLGVNNNISAFEPSTLVERTGIVVGRLVEDMRLKKLKEIELLTAEIIKDWRLIDGENDLQHTNPEIHSSYSLGTMLRWSGNITKLEDVISDELNIDFNESE